MRFSHGIHVRLPEDEYQDVAAAAERWYRGNRTDLVRDAVTQHLDRLYAGTVSPAALPPRQSTKRDVDKQAEV